MATIEQEIKLHTDYVVQPILSVEQSASVRLQSMMNERQLSENYALRVFVSGGGCSGLQYGMTFDDDSREGDAEWEVYGLRVLVDPVSAGYLSGATISFQQDNMLAGAFKIENPNAASSCGCGHSFKSKNEQDAAEHEGYDEGYAGGGCGSCGNG